MLGPKEVTYPCISYTQEVQGTSIQSFYYVKYNRSSYFKFWRWPPEDWYFPGGILDSTGRHFRVVRLRGWYPRPKWLVYLVDEFFGGLLFRMLIGSNFSLELTEPVQLTLAEYKEEVSAILYGKEPRNKVQRDDLARTVDKLNEAHNFEAVVRFADWYQNADGGRVV